MLSYNHFLKTDFASFIMILLKQNITRDIDIKNKLPVTRGRGEGDNRRKKGNGCQGTCIKDTGTKSKGGGSRVAGGGGWSENGDNCT